MEDLTHAMQGLTVHQQPQEQRENDGWRELDAFRLLAEDQYTECKGEIQLLQLQNRQLQLTVQENMQALAQQNALIKYLRDALAQHKRQAAAALDCAQALQEENSALRS